MSVDVDGACRAVGIRVNDQVETGPHADIGVFKQPKIQRALGRMRALDHTATSNYTVLQDEADLSLKL